MFRQLNEEPEKFSPNVVMRPLYQEIILPNLAYIGGPGELAYWLQLKGFFDFSEVPFPILVPRNFALWVDTNSQKKLDKLHLEVKDLFQELEELKKRIIKNQSAEELSLSAEMETIGAVYDAIIEKAIKIDPTLKGPSGGEKVKTLKSLEGLEKRLLKAEKQKHEGSLKQLDNLVTRFFPNGSLQERYDNFIPLYLKHGKGFLDALFENFDPLNQTFQILEEQAVSVS